MTEPTTQAAEALLDDIGQLVRTIRIAAKVPDGEIVPNAARDRFVERFALIEAEAAAPYIAQIAALVVALERVASRAGAMTLTELPDGPVRTTKADMRAALEAIYADVLAALDPAAAQEWEQRLARAVEVRLDMVLEAGRYLDLASPEAEQRLYDALPHGLEGRRAIAQHTLHAMLAVSKIEQQAAMQGEGSNK